MFFADFLNHVIRSTGLRRRPCDRGWRMTVLCVVIAIGPTAGSQGLTPEEREFEMQGKFLYDAIFYSTWSKRTNEPGNAPLLVGVVGAKAFRGLHETLLQGKTLEKSGSRRIEVREVDDLTYLTAFHCIFISASEEPRLRQVLAQTSQSDVLTVGETPAFYNEGGIIRLVRGVNNYNFEINPDARMAQETAGLTLSSKFLALAKRKHSKPKE